MSRLEKNMSKKTRSKKKIKMKSENSPNWRVMILLSFLMVGLAFYSMIHSANMAEELDAKDVELAWLRDSLEAEVDNTMLLKTLCRTLQKEYDMVELKYDSLYESHREGEANVSSMWVGVEGDDSTLLEVIYMVGFESDVKIKPDIRYLSVLDLGEHTMFSNDSICKKFRYPQKVISYICSDSGYANLTVGGGM